MSKIYINGILDASVAANVYPSFISTVYAYLNVWGASTNAFSGLIDELQISKIQRST